MDPRLHDLHEPLHHHLNQHLHHSSPASPIISPHVPLSPATAARYAMFHSDPTPLSSSASFERIESLSGSSHAIRSGDFIAAASSSSTLDESMSPSSSSILRRVIVLGETHANRSYCSNKLQTAKYETTWQLLVYGLISCIFSSVASVYFFTVGLLQIFTPWRYLHDAHLISARELELIQAPQPDGQVCHDGAVRRQQGVRNAVPVLVQQEGPDQRQEDQLAQGQSRHPCWHGD
jgi:hypothetical protein